jgi:hypothetical protein
MVPHLLELLEEGGSKERKMFSLIFGCASLNTPTICKHNMRDEHGRKTPSPSRKYTLT